MNPPDSAMRHRGKIPEISFTCKVLLFNSSFAYVRVQSTFSNNIQDWGITETKEIEAQNYATFSQEFAIPFIVGFDHTQKVRLTLFGGDTLKVGHGFPLGYVELSLMEIAAQPKDVPILIQGEATVGYLRIRSSIKRIRQDFELTSSDPIVSLGFAESAPTLEKLRAKKSSFLDIRTSYTVEFHCSQLFRSNPTDNKPMPTTLMGTKTKAEIIQQFLSMVKVKKLQYSVQLFVTTDSVPDEFFFVDDLDIDDLESWRMVYSTRKLDFFRPTLHDQSTEISEEVLMGEQGLHNHPNLNMAFVVLLHYVTDAGQEGMHTLAATVKHMTDHVTAIQDFTKQEQERKKQPSASTPAPTRPDCQIAFQRTRSISRYMDSAASPSLKSAPSGLGTSRFKSRLMSRGLSQLLTADKAAKAKDGSTDSGGQAAGGPAAPGDASSAPDAPDSASLDEFTQTLLDFTTAIRTTMVVPLTFTMLPRVDQQVVVTGPKYEEKLQALFQECHQDWQQRMTLPFLFSMHMFQSASDSATVMLQRLNDGCLLTPVVLVDMFHPCLQQTLLHRARRKNKKPTPHCETSRQSCNVLHALLTFYEGLSPFFPAGAITAIAGGNVRIPAVIPADSAPRRASLAQRSADRDGFDAAFGWLTNWFGGGSGLSTTCGAEGSAVNATKAVRYVRRHGFPYVEEVLLARPPPPPPPPRGHKKRRGHDDGGGGGLQWLQAATCFAPAAPPRGGAGSASHDSTATATATVRSSTWAARNVAAWKRAVESACEDYDALSVTFRDARDVIRGFMEAAEAFLPVTDSFVYAQDRGLGPGGPLDGGGASTTSTSTSSLVDGRYRRRRLALYTGTEYDIDLSDEDVRSLLPAPCHVPTLGKNHDFTLLRTLLQPSTGATSASTGAKSHDRRRGGGGGGGAAWTVTPVVWVLGRSPPTRIKLDDEGGGGGSGAGLGRHHSHGRSFHSFTLNTNLHERLQRLSAAFPVLCRDKCLVIVLAAEHRYDFPVVGRDGHSIDELRAIAHPFDDFHKELGEMLKQRRVQAQQLAQQTAAAAAVAVEVPDNVFLIHHYAFSEVLARALEYEMLLDPQSFQHRRGSHHPRHHHHHRDEAGGGGGGGGHRGSVRGSSAADGAAHVVIHRLPKLSSLRAILSLIFCSNYHHRSGSPRHGATSRHGGTPRGGVVGGATSTVDEHVIDQILGTGEEIIDRHVRDVNRAEELQRKPAQDKSRSDPLEVMRNMGKRASTIASKLGLVDKRKRQRHGGDEESAADRLKRDVIADFRHLSEIKQRFDAAIAEYVRRQYQHIVATALLDVDAARAAAEEAAAAKAKSKAEAAAAAAAAAAKAAPTTRSAAVSLLLQPSASSDSAPVQPAATVEAPAAPAPTAMGMGRVFSDEDDEDDDGPVLSLPMPLAAKSLSERGLLGKWRESFYHRSPRAGDTAANANGAAEAKEGLQDPGLPATDSRLGGLRPSPLRLQVDSDDDEDYDGASAQRPSQPPTAEDDDEEVVLMPSRPTLFPSQKFFNPLRRIPTAK